MWDWLNNGRWGKRNRDHQSWNAWLHVRLTSTLVDVVITKKNVPSTRKLVVTLTGVAACNFQLYVRTRWLEARSARPIRFYLATTSPGQICMYKPPPPVLLASLHVDALKRHTTIRLPSPAAHLAGSSFAKFLETGRGTTRFSRDNHRST